MMVVLPVKQFDMQGYAGRLGNRMEPVFDQLGIHLSQPFLGEFGIPHQKRPPGNVERYSRQRLVHRRIGRAVAFDSRLVAQRFGNRLTDGDGAVLCGMMLIDMQIAVYAARDIDQRMPRKLLDHVIEETNACRNVIGTRTIEIHLDADIRFMGLSLYPGSSHELGYKPEHTGINRIAHLKMSLTAIFAIAQSYGKSRGACKIGEISLDQRAGMRTYSGMDDTPPDSLIPYDEIVQEALRAVVGRVLGEVEATGGTLPGTHHFYITFKTRAPGVSIPADLMERFPDEMTIVMQNKFWDLSVREDGFSIGLSFNQIPAMLDIPFAAITAFVDPAVDFGLQFQAAESEDGHESHDAAENDGSEPNASSRIAKGDDGSNVVNVDFGKKK